MVKGCVKCYSSTIMISEDLWRVPAREKRLEGYHGSAGVRGDERVLSLNYFFALAFDKDRVGVEVLFLYEIIYVRRACFSSNQSESHRRANGKVLYRFHISSSICRPPFLCRACGTLSQKCCELSLRTQHPSHHLSWQTALSRRPRLAGTKKIMSRQSKYWVLIFLLV